MKAKIALPRYSRRPGPTGKARLPHPGWFILLLCMLAVRPALAHWIDLSSADVQMDGARLVVHLTFPTSLVPFADDAHQGVLSQAEVVKHADELKKAISPHLEFSNESDTAAVLQSIEYDANPVVPDGQMGPMGTHSTVTLEYQFSQPPTELKVHYSLFTDSPTAHAILAVRHGQERQVLLFTPQSTHKTVGGHSIFSQVASFVGMGVEHILTGYDHILFIITLLMAGGSLKYLIQVVSSFTVAHSITLTLAALNIVSLPPRVVECCIALSIAYVALENIYKKNVTDKRWIVTFFFGLVHGLGFASILGEFKLTGSQLAVSLVSFNVGVEVGQVIIIVLASVALARLRQFSWEPRMRTWVSAGVTGIACFWFIQRAFLGG
ncbi:MAG TPA: HupE/UreJ family protein [Candidatus Xenobia bacterium]|jgi:hypothetical protein